MTFHSPRRSERSDAPAAGSSLLAPVRAAYEALRGGRPVLLCGSAAPSFLLAAETAQADQLDRVLAAAAGPPGLILTPMRAASLLRRPFRGHAPVAFRGPSSTWTEDGLRRLADPVLDAGSVPEFEDAAAPETAETALLLAKMGLLLPVVLAVPAPAPAAESAARLGITTVREEDVRSAPERMAASLRIVTEAAVPLDGAENTRVVAFRSDEAGVDHLAIVIGAPEQAEAPLVRLHSECFTGDLLGSLRCDCGPQLRGAIKRMAAEGAGVLLYLAQEGRGIGLVNKLRAYALQDRGLDTLDANRALGFEPDERSFAVAATMLNLLGIHRLRLLTNNPDKLAALAEHGIEVVGREEHAIAPNGTNDFYLATKARRFGHFLD